MIAELSRESERVLRIRRRTEQELRAYIESGAMSENRTVGKLINKLEQLAVILRNEECNLKSNTSLSLSVGKIELSSPDSIRLKQPDEQLQMGLTTPHINSREPSVKMLASLNSVKVQEVAIKVKSMLMQNSPQTISQLIHQLPISEGLEELVAYIRIARAVKLLSLHQWRKLSSMTIKAICYVPAYQQCY